MKSFLFIRKKLSVYVIITANLLCIVPLCAVNGSLLTPYTERHGSRLSHREISNCQPVAFKGVPYELHHSPSNSSSFSVEVKTFVKQMNSAHTLVQGHFALSRNPVKTVTVLEPREENGCKVKTKATVTTSSKQSQCLVAMNAGFFRVESGECLGNIISNGRKVLDSGGIQNAHFGIKKNGSLFTGYLSEEEMKNASSDFQQLVGGVIWLVRNRTIFVNESMFMECADTETTGPMERFVNVRSARTSVGHDAEGNVMTVHVEGKTDIYGVNLWELAEIMKDLGAVNAINLDGGGSATFLINGTVVNYPSDQCHVNFHCEREVSTILCIHPPVCLNCSIHGECTDGVCHCKKNWLPPNCDHLQCGESNCSHHGLCTDRGCVCNHGWSGSQCDQSFDFSTSAEQYFFNTTETCRIWTLACVVTASIAAVSLIINCIVFVCPRACLCQNTPANRYATTRKQRNAYKTVNLGELLITSSDEETETILNHK